MIPKVKQLFSSLWPRAGRIGFFDVNAKMPAIQSLLIMSQKMTSLRDTDEMLGYLLGEIQKNLNLDCGVLMVEEDQFFRVRCHRGFSAPLVSEFKVSLGEGPVGECFSMREKKVVCGKELAGMSGFTSVLTDEKWRSALLLPLLSETQTIGVFLALSKKEQFFNHQTFALVDPYVQILSLGIRNAQLVERLEKFHRRLEAEVASTTQELTLTNQRLIRRVRELKALYEITLTSGMSKSLEEIFATVTSRVQELFDVERVGYFINLSSNEGVTDLVLHYPSFGLPPEVGEHLRMDSSLPSEAGPAMQMIMEASLSGQHRVYSGPPSSLFRELPSGTASGLRDICEDVGFRSLVAIPLKTSQKVLGVMVLMNPTKERFSLVPAVTKTPEGFSEEEMRTLTLVAIRVTSSIENIQLDLENRRRLADLSTLREISGAFSATPVLEATLEKIVQIILKSLPCDLCTFMFFDMSANALVTHPIPSSHQATNGLYHSVSMKDESNICSKVFADGQSRILDDVQSSDLSVMPLGTREKMHSMIFVLLKVENDKIGLMQMGSAEKSFFNRNHLRLAELIADSAAVIVQNARLYEKIIHANRELERLNRVKTDFVSMVSHELRTPVTAIKGFVDLVMNEEAGPVNEQQKRFLKIAHNSIDRLTLLISDLLDISRIESGQMKLEFSPISMGRILNDSTETYRALIESKKIKFTSEIDKKLPTVVGDESRIKQVVDNLLSNAMKFTPGGGTIRMMADDLGDFVLVSVSDTGVGIGKGEQEKIFEKFYQVDSSLTRQVGGTGLGLAISKSIVEMHGGRIWVESEIGKGATFRFLLPRQREKMTEEYISVKVADMEHLKRSSDKIDRHPVKAHKKT